MGIRPFIKIVVGLHYSKELYRESTTLLDNDDPALPALTEDNFNWLTGKYKDDSDVYLSDVFHYGSPLNSSPEKPSGFIGFIAGAICEGPITRALFALWESNALNNAILGEQVYSWPQSPEKDNRLRLSKMGGRYTEKFTSLACVENRMYQYFCDLHGAVTTDMWFKCGLYVLHSAGFTEVKREDLQTCIVFGWE